MLYFFYAAGKALEVRLWIKSFRKKKVRDMDEVRHRSLLMVVVVLLLLVLLLLLLSLFRGHIFVMPLCVLGKGAFIRASALCAVGAPSNEPNITYFLRCSDEGFQARHRSRRCGYNISFKGYLRNPVAINAPPSTFKSFLFC